MLAVFLFTSAGQPQCCFSSGAKQNGTVLGDVFLPPWAKGDPKEFIRIQREVGGVRQDTERDGWCSSMYRERWVVLVNVQREVGGVRQDTERGGWCSSGY